MGRDTHRQVSRGFAAAGHIARRANFRVLLIKLFPLQPVACRPARSTPKGFGAAGYAAAAPAAWRCWKQCAVVVGRPVRQYLLMAVIWRRSEKRRGKCTIRNQHKRSARPCGAFLVRNHHPDPSGTCDWSGRLRHGRRGEGDVDDAEYVCGIFFFGTRVRQDGGRLRVGVCSDDDGGP